MTDIKLLAYYLPQYHPIPENDLWWGKGFTEWTNVAKAKPLFKGHYQPRVPADLGFYDLRLQAIQEEQASLASQYGINGFCYYHYWFGNGKLLLETPIQAMLNAGKPNFPFMMCWANQTWKGVWFGAKNNGILIEQTYPGVDDYEKHFAYLLPFFKDERYIKVDNRPVFQVYIPTEIPHLEVFVNVFNTCAKAAGFDGMFLIANNCPRNWNPTEHNFQGVICSSFHDVRYKTQKFIFSKNKSFANKLERRIRKRIGLGFKDVHERTSPLILTYEEVDENITQWPNVPYNYFPQVLPDWDNSARSGKKSFIVTGSTPQKWKKQLLKAYQYVLGRPNNTPFIFIKSWNEWAEGNYLEPDLKWGSAYLQATKEAVEENARNANSK